MCYSPPAMELELFIVIVLLTYIGIRLDRIHLTLKRWDAKKP